MQKKHYKLFLSVGFYVQSKYLSSYFVLVDK